MESEQRMAGDMRWVFVALAFCSLSASITRAQKQDLIPARPGVRVPVVTAVAIHPSDPQFAYAGDDHLIRFRALENDSIAFRLEGHTDWIRSLAFSPGGDILASGGNDRRILLWDTRKGKLLKVLLQTRRAISDLAFSPSGKYLACVGFQDKLQLIELATGQVRTLDCPCADMRCIAFHPTQDLLAGAGRNGMIRIWKTTGEQLRESKAHRQRIRDLIYTRDGQQLVSVSEDRRVRVESVTTGQAVDWEVKGAKLLSVAEYSPGKIAVGGTDNQVHLYDLASQQEIRVLKQHTGSVSALACRGDYLVSGSYDTAIRVRSSKDLNRAPTTKRSSPAKVPSVTSPTATSLKQNSDDTFRTQR